jgi:metallo-beta-lactamase class B
VSCPSAKDKAGSLEDLLSYESLKTVSFKNAQASRSASSLVTGGDLKRRGTALLLLFLVALVASIDAQKAQSALPERSDYLQSFPPHRVIGNIYFVGSKSLGIYLITTSKGDILINTGLEDSVPMIEHSVAKLGFRFADIKILLISHAHFDHDAGAARIKQLTGAAYEVMDADVPVVESGGRKDFFYGNDPDMLYAPAKVDRVLHDGDTVKLGDTVLTAHLTPGHTKGCTTWTMKAEDGGSTYDVVIVGSPNMNPGYKLVNNAAYPQIANDYEKTFQLLRSLHCDVFLGAHGDYYNMEAKFARLHAGSANLFIDPVGYKNYVDDRERVFRAELVRQSTESH